jgi:hypothetical protein
LSSVLEPDLIFLCLELLSLLFDFEEEEEEASLAFFSSFDLELLLSFDFLEEEEESLEGFVGVAAERGEADTPVGGGVEDEAVEDGDSKDKLPVDVLRAEWEGFEREGFGRG